jgi:hypothetical protein
MNGTLDKQVLRGPSTLREPQGERGLGKAKGDGQVKKDLVPRPFVVSPELVEGSNHERNPLGKIAGVEQSTRTTKRIPSPR